MMVPLVLWVNLVRPVLTVLLVPPEKAVKW